MSSAFASLFTWCRRAGRSTLPMLVGMVLLALLLSLLPSSGPLSPRSVQAAALYTAVPVSDVGTNNVLSAPNSSRMVAIGVDGTIYVAYQGENGVRVARSTNRGQSFDPSVQISTVNAPVSIAVDANGLVYVAYPDAGNIMFSRSTDSGQTFSTPVSVGAVSTGSVDIAVDSPYVYILMSNGTTLFVNDNSGVGSFTARSTGLPTLIFSGILVDPESHKLFVIGDDPNIYYTSSTDHGATWASQTNPSGSVFYSTYIGSFGFIGQQVYIAGWQTSAALIDLETGASSPRTFGNNAVPNGRTLAVDGDGNVIDGYTDGTNVYYAVSLDTGTTFGTPVTVATDATRMELALNPVYRDIVAAYEQAGQIYLSVFRDELPPDAPVISTPAADSTTGLRPTISGRAVAGSTVTVKDNATDSTICTATTAGDGTWSCVPEADLSFGNVTISATANNAQGTSKPATRSFTVAKGEQAITFDQPANKTYGDAPFTVNPSASSDLPVNLTSATSTVCTVSGNSVTLVGAGTCTLTASQAGDASYNPAENVTHSFTVAPAPLTVTAQNATRTVGQPNPTFSVSYTGFVNGETSSVLTGAPACSSVANAESEPGDYEITCTAGTLSAANYSFTFVNGTLTVTDKQIPTVTWATPAGISYGTPLSDAHLNATADVPGSFSYDPPAGTVLDVGTGQVLRVTFTPDDSTNYATIAAQVQLDVAPALLTVTAADQTISVGEALPAPTYQISGFVNSEDSSVVSGMPVCTHSVTTTSTPGSYLITCTAGTLSAANYSFTFVNGTLTVTDNELRQIFLPLLMQ